MNYLDLVNNVLVRLREDEVGSVSENSYSKLIGKFVVDAQRQVEDAYDWNGLSQTLTMETVSGLFNGVLVGSGVRFRLIDVINDTSNWEMTYRTTKEMNDLFLNRPLDYGPPRYYNFNGVNADGDTQVDIYPVPDGVYTLRFNITQPQDPLANASDTLKVPSEPVIFLAYAKAIAERGEDAGFSATQAYAMYKESLADHISIETNRYPEELIWNA
jgi:hypothetical protein